MVEKRNQFLKLLHPFFVCCTYLFLYVPIVVLILFSFNKSMTPMVWTSFSLKWYRLLWHDAALIDSLVVSLIVATAATVLSVLMGTAFVFASRWWRSGILYNLFYANILFPEILIAIGLLSFFTFMRMPLGYGSLIVGHTIIGLGFVVPIVRARFIELDPFLTEASLDLGASHYQTFCKITLPLLVPALVASALLVFTLSLDDFLIAFFCSSATVQTLSVYVYSLVREGVSPTVNAISAILLAVSSLLVIVLCFLHLVEEIVGHE